ncbi:hypothetical protein AURDEDRAFT_131488, partial [Auricularia subglabra TFB-10046 SS5]
MPALVDAPAPTDEVRTRRPARARAASNDSQRPRKRKRELRKAKKQLSAKQALRGDPDDDVCENAPVLPQPTLDEEAADLTKQALQPLKELPNAPTAEVLDAVYDKVKPLVYNLLFSYRKEQEATEALSTRLTSVAEDLEDAAGMVIKLKNTLKRVRSERDECDLLFNHPDFHKGQSAHRNANFIPLVEMPPTPVWRPELLPEDLQPRRALAVFPNHLRQSWQPDAIFHHVDPGHASFHVVLQTISPVNILIGDLTKSVNSTSTTRS